MANILFAALSLVSSFSKDSPNTDIKSLEIEKNSEYILSGTYTNVNNLLGLSVSNTDTEDYFYTFDVEPVTKIVKEGNEVDFGSINEGDKLKVTYDGSVSLVYPPKLNHVTKIEVVENEEK
ncbi:MAG: hypothetical protein WCR67_03595 [Bacilli bacterium]